MKKWATELNIAFSKKEVQMAKKQEEMLTILGYKRNTNQNHGYLTPVKIAAIKNTNN
jgi:hypothetical protein